MADQDATLVVRIIAFYSVSFILSRYSTQLRIEVLLWSTMWQNVVSMYVIFTVITCFYLFSVITVIFSWGPSVLWHHWLGDRKGIRPVKNMGDGGDEHWLVRMEWRPAGWSMCLPLSIFPCTIKSRSFLLAPALPGSPGKRAVNGCGVVVVGAHFRLYQILKQMSSVFLSCL